MAGRGARTSLAAGCLRDPPGTDQRRLGDLQHHRVGTGFAVRPGSSPQSKHGGKCGAERPVSIRRRDHAHHRGSRGDRRSVFRRLSEGPRGPAHRRDRDGGGYGPRHARRANTETPPSQDNLVATRLQGIRLTPFPFLRRLSTMLCSFKTPQMDIHGRHHTPH